MINFRFHIVSLTAVLLALGIGLVLGTTFLDEATVKGLERQLQGLEHDLDAAQSRNEAQQRRLGQYEDEAEQLHEQLGERLYGGQLVGQPVLVVSTQGVAQDWVDRVSTALDQAEADVLGVWWLSDRLTLDDDNEIEDLAGALELTTSDNGRLHRSLAVQLADVLYGAVDSPPEEQVAAEDAPAEPALLARLREAGFLRYQLPEGEDSDVVRLPSSRLRVVVIDGPEAAVPAGDLLVPVLTELTADGPMPVVATQPSLPSGDEDEDDGPAQPELIGAVRGDDDLRERVSTVDNLDRVPGVAATVLATADAVPGEPVIGRYGSGDGADRLLPPPVGDG
ncbi:MAG TPA: copper transporter [Acidimicrobiales bacterium]